MTGEEKQGVLFGDEGKEEKPVVIHEKSELISNRKPEEKRPYLIRQKSEINGDLKYYNLNDLEMMRSMGYEVKPILDPTKKIESIDMVPNSEIACEICEDLTEEQLKDDEIENVQRGVVKVGYGDEDRMVCEYHKPDIEVKEVEAKKQEVFIPPSFVEMSQTRHDKDEDEG
ncbi:MAG: hypothetical protein US68_C0017G0013 [Candidatus Shapirobacteria bacterium GW2011_GWE1_38_10]|uniref:Uncharacterized protein n=1 Tax=Candidatus Shapirobacteria bacterium GW2011_GWE1_38_10 TaxID=1618488 RepID=A0A0G0I3W1_9BACT|nr:MAG: hypothetical protein US46_C0004G0100 [Candidatus Shapirobacteria bacterium GW2011_GWF2_37_20]KKQ49232.1 MAG: hypothetical protein US68_C0017G0013 [Candidatus Shapirobacteria bacterium GW2011_GWE1_38_10]KKQ62878.1 MAG: hypothetical protein US85_C0021G0007 [Candidatus Shapirobacteria bacterium GW2011_GWF1_38_23]HBP50795.1 hypothetical protein [Candidatus Shapirobacteria bacterium]